MSSWKKSPPTYADVVNHPHWWNRNGSSVCIVELSADAEKRMIWCHDTNNEFDPGDWGKEWAMCVPPIDN